MNILMFGWEWPPFNSGGLGTACFGLVRSLTGKGAKVVFVLPKKISVNDKFAKFVFACVPISRLTAYGQINAGGGLLDEVLFYARKARTIAQEEEFDVIHAHDWLCFGAGIEAKKVSGKPLVVHVHATEYDRTGGGRINPTVYQLEKDGMVMADRVVTVSQFTKDMVVRHYGIDPNKIEVVHNGIDAEDYPPIQVMPQALKQLKQSGHKVIVFVGRLTLQKGPDYFVKLAKKVLELRPKTIFVVAGSGDMQNQCLREAADLSIADKIIFTGFLRGEELNQIYRAADLYVLPSVSEPFGITPLEAIMNGAPVLISKQSGVSEIIRHALKADFWDIDEMTDKVVAVIDNPVLYRCLQNCGHEEVKRLDWGKAAQKCLELYKRFMYS